LFVPFLAAAATYGWLAHLVRGPLYENWDRYREFWGGNPSEVFSHWLDVVLMTGGVAAMAWLLVVEAFLRKRQPQTARDIVRKRLVLYLVASGVVAVVLDFSHGEQTVWLVYGVLFLPMLVSTWYLMRRCAELLGWRPVGAIVIGLGTLAFHGAAQWHYEPSESGAPNLHFFPIWIGCTGLALVWALIRGVRTGSLVRFGSRCLLVIRKPRVHRVALLVCVAIGVPTFVVASRIRKTQQEIVYHLLDQVEAALTDGFIAGLKRDHIITGPRGISPSPSAERLLTGIKDGSSLRIFIPVNDGEHLSLFGNADSQYCDIRSIARGRTEQVDQGFIDALISNGGTRQSCLLAVYVTPYIAGRVLEDASGKLKALCVISRR
jgi:hypothetical protein